MPMQRSCISAKNLHAIILEEDLETDGVVLDSAHCHNSVITTKCTNESVEPCQ